MRDRQNHLGTAAHLNFAGRSGTAKIACRQARVFAPREFALWPLQVRRDKSASGLCIYNQLITCPTRNRSAARKERRRDKVEHEITDKISH